MKITRISLCTIDGHFHKFVSMNSHGKNPGGLTLTNTLIRVRTDQDVEGIGVMSYPRPDDAYRQALRSFIGEDPLSLYEMENGRVVKAAPRFAAVLSKYPHLDAVFLDLIGRVNGVPCWKLLGDAVRQEIRAYDGTIYFADIWFKDRGVGAVVEEVEEAIKMGYTGVKLKVGRGFLWMDKDAGITRDLEVLRAARKTIGPTVSLMADDNNAFEGDFDRAWKFLSQTQDMDLYWIEEIFPETVDGYSRLKDRMVKAGMKTRIADGENFRETVQFEPYLKPRRMMDVLQLDIRSGGLLKCREMGRMAAAAGGTGMPHNWASQFGVLTALQLCKACPGIAGVEDDRSRCDVLVPNGYSFRNGSWTVPDTPGMSVGIDEKLYRSVYQARETVLE